MKISLIPNCFARPSDGQSNSKPAHSNRVRNFFKQPVGFIKTCFGIMSSDTISDSHESTVSTTHVDTVHQSHATPVGSHVQTAKKSNAKSTVIISRKELPLSHNCIDASHSSQTLSRATTAPTAASTATPSPVGSAGSVWNHLSDTESGTESVHVLSIPTASMKSSSYSSIPTHSAQTSAACSSESQVPPCGDNDSSIMDSNSVSDQDLVVTFESQTSSVIRRVESMTLSTPGSSSHSKPAGTRGRDTLADLPGIANVVKVDDAATVIHCSPSIADDIVKSSNSTNDQVKLSNPDELEPLPLFTTAPPKNKSLLYSRCEYEQPGRLRRALSLTLPSHHRYGPLNRNASAPQLFGISPQSLSASGIEPMTFTTSTQEGGQCTTSRLSSIMDGSDVVAMTAYSLTKGWDDIDWMVSCDVGEVLSPPSLNLYDESYKALSFTVAKTLGRGAFGTVVLAIDNLGHSVALKLLPSAEEKGERAKEVLNREIKAQTSIRHRNAVQLLATFSLESRFFFVMEYAANGSLSSRIAKAEGNGLGASFAAKVMLAVASALQALHSSGFVHRDIKPGNIVLGDNDEAKVCDFGICGKIGSHGPCITYCGTQIYCAPEVDGHQFYDETVDLWSLGVVLYEMLTGDLPFENGARPEHVVDIRWPEGSTIDGSALDLIRQLVCLDAKSRLPLSKVRTHPWILQNALNARD